jgi:citrate lyase subunit beta/citryl-CoA lyase
VQSASLYLDALEVREGLAVGSTRILPIVTETARAAFAIGDYAQANLPRLYGLTWGAEDLSVDVGATRNTDEDGRLSLTYRLVRSLTLLAAKSCGVQAIDAVYPDYTNLDGLRIDCSASRKEGFTGRFAIHPDQVEVINTAFSPSKDDIDYALEVVAAFEASPGAGTVGLNGKMLDKPHLIQAQKVLALRDALAFRK